MIEVEDEEEGAGAPLPPLDEASRRSCPMCLDYLDEHGKEQYLFACAHSVCAECYADLVNDALLRNKCPTCRGPTTNPFRVVHQVRFVKLTL